MIQVLHQQHQLLQLLLVINRTHVYIITTERKKERDYTFFQVLHQRHQLLQVTHTLLQQRERERGNNIFKEFSSLPLFRYYKFYTYYR